jgi:amino acid adenylation domain-containing protein/thioester reductase-like protein/non-ribosomal peptide synthase protein (TIGR01720 family)
MCKTKLGLSYTEYPLTSYQKDIWLEQCLYSGKPIYNLGGFMDIKGKIDNDVLNKSINMLIKQNDCLRMSVIDKNGEPYLKILSENAYKVPFYDFSNKENPYETCIDWLNKEFLEPFDLTGNLFQFALLKSDENTYFWLIKFHHIIIDGFGIGVLYKQVIENYNQLMTNVIEDERIIYSYTDFIDDNQKYLKSQTFLKDKEFWKAKYQTIPEPLFNRTVDSDNSTDSSVVSDRVTFSIKRASYNKMIAFSEVNGCSVFHFILGVLFTYFSRVCNKEEIVIGVPILNRGKAKYKQTIGLFANVVPLRINLGKDISLKELMLMIKNELMECYRHQKFPIGEIYRTAFEQVKEKSHIFDISLSYVNRDFSDNFVTASDYDIVSLAHQHERNALTIFVREYNDQKDIYIDFDYQISVFEKFMPIEAVIAHFKYLLDEVIESSEKSISEIEIIPEEEKQKILYDFNNTKMEYPKEKTIQELFEEQVNKVPDHVAVVFGNRSLTYRELNARANKMAKVLRNKGVKPDSIVGIMLDRSIEIVVGILGVLKAGGAYLPIDPNYPTERINYILEDSSTGILLIQKHLKDRVSYQGQVIDIEDDIYKGDNEKLENINKSSDLAYIIYTSGSTGKPKGVMIEHRGIANLKTFFQQNYHVDEKDNMLQFASSSFDASVWEIFTSLLTGATLYMVPKETINNLVDFENFINNNEITMTLLPPTYLASMEPARVTKLKNLFTGGSAITKELVDKWKEKFVYSNAYGPTESTIMATTWKYNEQEWKYSQVPIGRPISNMEIYILDRKNRLLPIGSAGELCIGGDGLARGYLHKPELTAEKFVANPYRNGETMYKTGDLARWLPDGNIEFLGRMDYQVKIRGFRIELGEIETELLKYPAVKEAIVIDREDQQGDKYLVAYFVSDSQLTIDELREHLLKELPEYMVPSYMIQLDNMPLTSNDKVDRSALPEPDCSRESGAVYIAPRDNKETILVKLWQEVLKVEQVGIRDNFFNLGGDSIKAIQILSRLNAYSLKLEMKDLFKHPVIEELGAFVQEVTRTAEQGIIESKVNLTPIQHWLFEQKFAEKHYFNQAVMLYRQEGFAEEELRSVFSKLVEHHDALRMVAKQEENGVVLFNRGLEGKLYSLEVFDLRKCDKFREVIEAEANKIQASLDLSYGPLVKVGLFKTETGDHLLIVIHHAVVDGISWRIILQDLFNGYMQALRKETVQFADKTDSFNIWADQLSTYANSRELLKEVDYWAEFEGLDVKALPKDQTITERKYEETEQVHIELTEQDTENLLKDVNQAYSTEINDILLTALGLAVKEWTGEDRVLINLEGHGREEIIKEVDISRTVGWFTAQYPVMLNMGKNKDLAYSIKSVKEGMRRIPNKGIGYGILKYLTLPENKKNLKFNLKPEISFNYLGQFEADADNGGFGISDVSVGMCVSPTMEPPYAIDINGMVTKGRLILNFTYHKAEYDRATIAKFAESFRWNLIDIVAHCTAHDYTELTPSDFTLKKFTLDELEIALNNLNTRNIKDLYQLSPMQEGMLYHAMKDNESSAYFEQAVLSIEGKLDISHLEESFNKLIEKYDIFRTVFVYEKLAKPIQVVMKEQRAWIDVENIVYLAKDRQREFIEAFKVNDKTRGFDLQRGMPIRLSVIQTGTDSYKLIWSFHHIIMDGWCLGIIFKEFFGMYARLQENRLPELDKVYPYSNYIKWLDEQEHKEAAAYWEGYLRDYEEPASLSRNGTLVQGKYEQEEVLFSFDEGIRCGLEQIARKNNVTLSTIIQTIWGLLLARYNNSDDVVFGAVVSGRPHEIMGIEKMVGLFINTLPVRIKCDGNQTLAQLLQEVQLAAVESEGYSYYPLVEIQARTSVKDALFDHIIAFENYPIEEVMNGNYGVDIKTTEVFEQTNYDFNMVVIPGRELNIKFIYNALVYDRRFIETLKEHIKTMTLEVLGNPEILVKDIDMLTVKEEKELLDTFNHTKREYPKDKTISELFEEQVRRTPDNIAVVFEDRKLTYRVLNEKANQLASVLRSKGVAANTIVGIMAERSPEMIIGLMGILKAGGTYLPIDPEYPAERISYMLADSGSGVLLTQTHLVNKMAFNGDIIDLEEEGLYQGDAVNLVRANNSQDLAYVIYTSGSTGKPKGVEIEHASLVNLVFWHQRAYHITAEDRATLVAGPAFDASVWETWPYLVSGAGLYIPNDKIRVSTTELIKWLHDNLITISFMPTPLAEALLAEDWPREIALRTMLTGGDKLHRRPQLAIPFTLVNHYGPTENTVVATKGGIRPEESDILPSIGRPIDNTNIYIVDKNDRLQPIGTPGEMCISGDGLARGYLNRPELTAEKFVANPFRSGTKMYRTGDLARWLPDGNIEFLGRIDHQVKIRGFRMELGEIESRMLKHEAVKEAVVIAREDKQGDKYLAAYLVADRELSANEIKVHLLKELPEYMVPLYFTQLDKLPLTPNGKIDRKALPVPAGWGNTGEYYIGPRNEADGTIQKVWQDILGINRIGMDDNFFMLGGNSIKAIQVVAKLAMDFEIGINDIFQCQTIRNLSDTIKYSKNRLKVMIDAMNEVAATKNNSISFDGNLRSRLKKYKSKNQVYEQTDLFELAHYKNILLAGSTGYLGIHILYQLLKDTDYMVYVPIRGKDDQEAKARLWGKMEFYFNLNKNDQDILKKRICVLRGDLSKEYLGLDPKKYMELADSIDCIINSAANVKHYGHYSEFQAVNVKGNQSLVEFANTGKKKAYNYISTTSVGSGYVEGKDRLVFTEYDCDMGQSSDNYYVATKLEAEKFLLKARQNRLEVNVFRVGNLVFDSETGVFQENIEDNAFYTLVKSLIKIGCFPEIDEKTINFSFIDYVAKAVVLLFDKVNLQNETYHLFNTNQISIVALGALLKQAGMDAKTIPVDVFIKYLYEKYEDEEAKNHIARILVHSNMFFEGASKTSFIIQNKKTENILKRLNFKWPELDSLKVRLMMEHCKKVGFI